MNGQVLNFSIETNSGVITGADGNRYNFTGAGWREQDNPARGMSVDFDVDGGNAVSIYRDIDATVPAPEPAPAAWPAAPAPAAALPKKPFTRPYGAKSKVVAALLAFFLGALGIHKFYLGYTGPGVTILVVGGIGLFFRFSDILLPWSSFIGWFITGAIALICLIEAIIYLTRSDEDFHQTYVTGEKPWF